MIDDISYFETGYIDETYFTRIAMGEVALAVSATLQAQASKFHYITGGSVIDAQADIYGPTTQTDILGTVIPEVDYAQARTYISLIGDVNA